MASAVALFRCTLKTPVNRFVMACVVASATLANAQSRDAKSAQAEFARGVEWLHSFMYEDAIDAFRAAQKMDPSFVLAYWGEALSFSQPLWFYEELPQARAALAKLGATPEARVAKAKTPRQQGFLRAVEALFGPGDKAARHSAYAQQMAGVASANSADDDAQAFYALSLLATMP